MALLADLIASPLEQRSRRGWIDVESYYTRYKYVRDCGGAWIREIRLLDGKVNFFRQEFDSTPATKALQMQSPGIDDAVVKTLMMPQAFEIHFGLGVSVRTRFKNQMRLQKIKGDFQGEYGPADSPGGAHPTLVPGFQPEGSWPDWCGKVKWRILPVGWLHPSRPPAKAATGGMRHGRAYQDWSAAA